MKEKTIEERVKVLEEKVVTLEKAIWKEFRIIPNMELNVYAPEGVPDDDPKGE